MVLYKRSIPAKLAYIQLLAALWAEHDPELPTTGQALAGEGNRIRNAPQKAHIPTDPLQHAKIDTLLVNHIIVISKSRNKVSVS